MHEVLQSASLFILPSKNESFGLAALEAMSCGVPVIAARSEGIPEVVLNNEVGFLSEVGDVDDMARNCLRLLKDKALYHKMSLECRKQALEKYERSKLISVYEDYYYKVLSKP